MVVPEDKSKYLSDLLILVLDGSARQEHYVQLNEMLRRSEANRRIYMEFMTAYVGLNYFGGDFIEQDSDVLNIDMDLWQEMSEREKTAPQIEISQDNPQRELIQKVVYPPRQKRKASKFGIIFLAMNTAAIFFFFLFLRFVPPKGGIEVATLTDSINAKWANADSMDKGTRMATRSDEFFLRNGLAELLFDNKTKVVIEGPAEFTLLAEDRIDLRYGRIYATVPPGAMGFTINTPTSRVIDLGTEFGVQADPFGDVYLHVIKGKTTLIAGEKTNKVNLEVTAGHAKKVSSTTQEVSDIPYEKELFVRDIRSDSKCVWRGQTELDLADMVGGGNGLGTGRINAWLNLKTGEEGTDLVVNPQLQSQLSMEKLADLEKRFTDNSYKNVFLPYVDGVFSPDGGMGTVQVSSQGHVWSDCPDTSGIYFEDIFNGSYISTSYAHHLTLNNMMYGTKERPAIALHSNAGITFNLESIRQSLPDLQIVQFKAICGVSQEANNKANKEDFWVLVDGQKRFEAIGLKFDSGPREVTIPLSSRDHYLTLVSTDGDLNPSNDWGFFALPRLEIKHAQ